MDLSAFITWCPEQDHNIKKGNYTINLKGTLKESKPNIEAETDLRILIFNP